MCFKFTCWSIELHLIYLTVNFKLVILLFIWFLDSFLGACCTKTRCFQIDLFLKIIQFCLSMFLSISVPTISHLYFLSPLECSVQFLIYFANVSIRVYLVIICWKMWVLDQSNSLYPSCGKSLAWSLPYLCHLYMPHSTPSPNTATPGWAQTKHVHVHLTVPVYTLIKDVFFFFSVSVIQGWNLFDDCMYSLNTDLVSS